MPKDSSIRKVLVIGSGPIVIGQAAEFDYAGAQACRILREEGINVVLVNSNPATIMTDKNLADEIYLEPLNKETVARIIEKERPDSLLAGLGGQTGLTIAMQLARYGVLEKYGVRLLGSDIYAIDKAEAVSYTHRIAPWREWDIKSRDEEIDYAAVSYTHLVPQDRGVCPADEITGV